MKNRIHLVDSLRGLVVVLMIFYHLAYDLYYYLDMPREWMYNPAMDTLQLFIGGTFILLSGASSRFTRSNLRRGVRLFVIAMGVTAVTTLMGNQILFGVLHFLSVCMILYGLTAKLWDAIPRWVAPPLYLLGLIFSRLITRLNPVSVSWLFPLGLKAPGFYSADYYPIFPWIFLFLLGTWLGGRLKERRGPERIYTTRPGRLAFLGRHALVIYIVHQPVLYGLVMLVALVR